MTTPARKLLATADEMLAAKTDEIRVLDDALAESWSLIRELRQAVEAKDERIATLEEYAGDLTRAARRGSPARKGERV